MRFHITTEVRDTIVLDEDKRMRESLGPHFQRIMESDKVQDSGLLCGKRGGFFIVEVDAPAELLELLGPEIYANFKTDVQPVAPMERLGELFQEPRVVPPPIITRSGNWASEKASSRQLGE